MSNDISDRVLIVKKAFNLSNVGLAEIMKVSKQAVGGWLNEGKTPSKESAEKLEHSIGVSAVWFRRGVGPMYPNIDYTSEQIYELMQRHLTQIPKTETKDIAKKIIKLALSYL